MIGRQLAHYEIIAPLGAGGMAEVYRARDLRLKREVALKILPASTDSDPEYRLRFQREAETVASLNHPNIVHLYSVEHAEGVQFITMELVEGRDLATVVRSGPLPLARLIETGIGICDALGYAHARGVIHRDLKPANVIVTPEERVKVLDFGLAKLTLPGSGPEDADSAPTMAIALTGADRLMGTTPYMSPEQLRATPVDARSDIFALGILLYELATGARPFRGRNTLDLVTAILRDDPPPLAGLNPELPPEFEEVVRRCLEKKPADRYASAAEVRGALAALRPDGRPDSGGAGGSGSGSSNRVAAPRPPSSGRQGSVTIPLPGSGAVPAAGSAAPPRAAAGRGVGIALGVAVALLLTLGVLLLGPRWRNGGRGSARAPAPDNSIAVLPFTNLSSDPEQAFFSDGLSEELLNLLARIPELKVISRSSAFSFRGKNVDAPEIGRRLGVAYLLEGSVRRSEGQIRISADLIDARDDRHIWSQTFDRKFDNVFAIQDEIAAAVVDQLKLKLLAAPPHAGPVNPEAYALVLRARQSRRLGTPVGLEAAFVDCRKALELAPDYALAWEGLARLYISALSSGTMPVGQGVELAREAANRALALDAGCAPALARLSWIAMIHDGDMAAAARWMQRALALQPTDPEILGAAGSMLHVLGRQEEAIAVRAYVTAQDPLNPAAHYNLAYSYYSAGRWAEAVAASRASLALSPAQEGSHFTIALALQFLGHADSALVEAAKEPSAEPRLEAQAIIHHARGRTADADAALAALRALPSGANTFSVAMVLACRGEKDAAFRILERLSAERGALDGVHLQPEFQPLHDDPRWRALLRKLGYAQEQLNAIPLVVALPT